MGLSGSVGARPAQGNIPEMLASPYMTIGRWLSKKLKPAGRWSRPGSSLHLMRPHQYNQQQQGEVQGVGLSLYSGMRIRKQGDIWSQVSTQCIEVTSFRHHNVTEKECRV